VSCTNRRNICLRLGVMRQTVFRLPLQLCPAPAHSAAGLPTKRPLSLGVIFLTLYIDLIGFSIIFPLGPTADYYLKTRRAHGRAGLAAGADRFAGAHVSHRNYAPVLFGGVLSSFFSILQLFRAVLGAISDRRGAAAFC